MIRSSELITNADGSIYHLSLHPGEIADTIITVGDPNRVARVSQHFDRIEVQRNKREFVTATGWIGRKRLTVVSTGIGTDNVDIVLHELDALVNIDFKTKEAKANLTSLEVIRMGTSGTFRREISVNSIISSVYGVGLDNLMHYYNQQHEENALSLEINEVLRANGIEKVNSYSYKYDSFLALSNMYLEGITLTCPGFYGPQNRTLRIGNRWNSNDWTKFENFKYDGHHLVNIEMETAGIYGLCREFGHKCMSVNVILANRQNGNFSTDPKGAVDKMIIETLRLMS